MEGSVAMDLLSRCHETVGEYIPESESHSEYIYRGWYRQGYIYKNWEAFYGDGNEVCYVPELSDAKYTRRDFEDMCGGNKSLAEELFVYVDWQHPESLLDEWCRHGEVCVCTKCGWLYNCYDDKVCPNCGTVHVDSI